MDSPTIIKGEIKFEGHALPFTDATLRVYLENVSLADASSDVVASYERRKVNYPGSNRTTLSFEIAVNELDENESYAIRVHVDLKGDGSVSKGDFISMQSYPVATFGYPNEISVLVKQVE